MQTNTIASVARLLPTCAKMLSARKGLMSQSITASMARPNTRMQPDAATRPQDRGFFESWIRTESHLDLSVRRG
jgi:hypothetical protein